jgi:hypothetical protein
MKFLNYEVWTQSGDVVEVSLSGNAANVLLMDDINFQSYRSGGRFNYYGGHFNRSPAVIAPPLPGRWHVIVDLGGGAGHVSAAVRVLHRGI